eukprot:COSAG02_NODE_98_length_37150_cov_39.614207_6_plen_64_part_00
MNRSMNRSEMINIWQTDAEGLPFHCHFISRIRMRQMLKIKNRPHAKSPSFPVRNPILMEYPVI